jgi:flagellar assembly protein FliH
MSSKLFRAGDSPAASAVAWEPGRAGAPRKLSARGIAGSRPGSGGASDQSEEGDALDARDTRIKAAAQQQGRNEAEAAANQRAMQKAEPVIAALNRIVQELAGARTSFRAEAEHDTVQLAIAIARRVLHRELSTDPEAILGLVMAASRKLTARETHRLRVSPSDAAAIQEHRSRLELPPGLEIVSDASLAPGSAIFETSRGELDASIGTQLAEIDRGFADIVRRRAH